MDNADHDPQSSPAAPQSRLTKDDRRLLRRIGSNLRRIISGDDVLDISSRNDELGILANMVNRVAKELKNSRQNDREQREQLQATIAQLQNTQHELEQTINELKESQAAQERLMFTVKELSTPILNIHQGISLLPIIGSIDDNRARALITTLLSHVARHRSQVAILDITGMPVVDTQIANVLLQAAQAVNLLGARVILCGMTPDVAQVVVNLGISFESLTPCSDLQAALETAFKLISLQVTRR